MKELTIEEKAERYDEAIKVAKGNYETIVQMDNDCTFAKEGIVNTFHHIFPELKESEDERIRKDIERAISVALDYSYFDKETANNSLAWLEKQGKISDKIVERARTEKQRILVTESDGVANIDWDTRSLQDVKLLLKYGLDYIKKLEKQGEQKLINKVEPKFKVGDIIKHKDTGETYEVSKIEAIYADEIYYHLTNGGCVCENSDNFERVEQKYVTDLRTWKYIVDAVLTEKEGIGQYLDSPFTEEVAKKLQKRFGNIEQKSAWSEEDENLLELSVDNLTELKNRFGEEYGRTRDCIDWIESLKKRCT